MASSTGVFDHFFEGERAVRQLHERSRQIEELLGPTFRIQEEMLRREREFEQSAGYRYLKAFEDDALRQKQVMDAIAPRAAEGLALQHLRVLDDNARRYQDLLDPISPKSVAEAERFAIVEREHRRLLETTSVLDSLVAQHHELDRLRGLQITSEFQRWADAEEGRRQILNVAMKSVAGAWATDLDIELEQLSRVFREAVVFTPTETSEAVSVDLWTIAVRLTDAIVSAFPSLDPKHVFEVYVFPIVVAILTLAYAEASSNRTNQRLDRIEAKTDHLAAPKRYLATRSVNLRSEPTRTGALVAKLPEGLEVEELDRNEHGWRLIRVPQLHVEGWAYYRNLRPE